MGDPSETPAAPPDPVLVAAPRQVPWLAVLTVAAALATTLGSVSLAGIWDSPEVAHAEFGRRIAHDLLGASELGGPGEPALTREALGRGELPFLSIALGFRLFGLSTQAGRVALALWGLAGIAALHWLVRRLGSLRAAWLAALALATSPLYFVQARTMVGDVVGMSANAVAMAGLALAVFDGGS
ncbi:MAG TPA: glycosyltransferase family 39 protein, partial [Polyangiaceae bacterium]|nr:glycosyltransferase family 39 protein [Polyangiaceae bacterium]